MIRNPCLFGIIANSIPIDQERSVGDILGAFLTGLRGRALGNLLAKSFQFSSRNHYVEQGFSKSTLFGRRSGPAIKSLRGSLGRVDFSES